LQLGNVTYSRQQLLSILENATGNNALVAIAHQEIAAKLNVANGADTSCIAETLARVDGLIGDHVVPPVGNGFLQPSDMARRVVDTLKHYNGGRLCVPRCGAPPQSGALPTAQPHATSAPRP
jgi:hypothetical protein